ATSWRADAHAVSCLQRYVLFLGQVGRYVRLAVPEHDHLVDGAVASTQNALRPETAVVHDEGGPRLSAQQLHLIGQAEAGAMLACAAGPLAQGIVTVKDRRGQ